MLLTRFERFFILPISWIIYVIHASWSNIGVSLKITIHHATSLVHNYYYRHRYKVSFLCCSTLFNFIITRLIGSCFHAQPVIGGGPFCFLFLSLFFLLLLLLHFHSLETPMCNFKFGWTLQQCTIIVIFNHTNLTVTCLLYVSICT